MCDYEVWEYPVIAENNAIKGYIIALLPTISENRWFPSKERSAAGYIPKHEICKISAQGALKASLQWKVPSGLPAFPRIYAVIDPANNMAEIHETNNIGWWVIDRSDFTTGVEKNQYSNRSESNPYYTNSYPNPFDESFTIAYECALPGNVSLKVYNARGSLVYSPGKEYKSAGLHTLEVPGRDLIPGLYYYRFTNGTITETRKIVKR